MLLHAVFQGNVQGVGFRATAKYLAERLHLTGTVCNMPNGAVEIFAQGPKEALETLLTQIQQEFSISHLKKTITAEDKHFDGFRITFH